MSAELLPFAATGAPGQPIVIEVRGMRGPGIVSVWRLGDPVLEQSWSGDGSIELPPLPAGGYGVELTVGEHVVRTAVDVRDDPRTRLRYGFTVDFRPGRDPGALVDTVRRLHLTGIQFYDWAYRHADLLGGGDEYLDALGQPVALATVRRLVAAVTDAGADALGYAAVYAVGPQEWPRWEHRALLTATGERYALGDFLFLVDPAAPDWREAFAAQLAEAAREIGFAGYHLDQYGYPKTAVSPDGGAVDVERSFSALIEAVRAALPASRLVFNNVNDFPTWRTGADPQDALYIEPWAPHTTLGDLADVARRARAAGGEKPIVLAAYQHVYDDAPAANADLATAFTMATLYSHGVTQLLAGEGDRVLVDPYYVRNHVVELSTADLLRRWYDFLVEHDELLLDPSIVEVTGSYAGEYNAELDVTFAGAELDHRARAGTVWRRVTRAGDRLVLHLINLVGQDDTEWDAPRAPVGDPAAGVLRFRRVGAHAPRVRVADPDGAPRLVELPVRLEGEWAEAELPPLAVWQLVTIERTPTP
ncbi:hypothetical protein GCM10009840_10530 [Pseudolysinimonas kribbensis]|uniref:Dextranase n=1 Tax=Pseudolysinimonas kribbensis TaxID=433641 RepID=A0ABQ6K6V7_9MICO|nr:glycoside hydrolase family 66 protein [Pseudolysinimonas kribbensis]GMA95476.1 hypothetical protein GCM10025881_23000 [Pseudolysinimonas kribbensis]